MLAQALEHLVRGIVDNPDEVRVRSRQFRGRGARQGGRGEFLEVRVHPDDLGRVIGRGGRTASALRRILQSLDDGAGIRIDFVDVDVHS